MAQWGGTAMFSKKVWVSVVWAAFRERNFEVGEPFLRARSVPSTVVKISHIRKRDAHFFCKKFNYTSFFAFPPYLYRRSRLLNCSIWVYKTIGLCPSHSIASYRRLRRPITIFPPLGGLRGHVPSATLPLLTTVDIRLIYGTYTVDIRYISIGMP